MTPDEMHKELQTYIDANYAVTKYTFSGVKFKGNEEPGVDETHVIFDVQFNNVDAVEIGTNGRGVMNGILWCRVFAVQQNERAGYNIAGQIIELLSRKTVNGVYLNEISELKKLEHKEDQKINIIVQIPFHAFI